MNQHLNLFRFFNESAGQVFIENNLSRAFALCLLNNSLLLNEFIQSVAPKHYDELFTVLEKDASIQVDLQIPISTIANESFDHVYAVAMCGQDIDMNDFFNLNKYDDKQENITDILIRIKNIAFIIEVKRWSMDCKEQLYNQVAPFIDAKNPFNSVTPVSNSWPKVIQLMEKVNNVSQILGKESVFINDFIGLSLTQYPDWFSSKPFSLLPFSEKSNTTTHTQLMKRIRYCLSKSNYDLLGYNDRLGIAVKFPWATEVIPRFTADYNTSKPYVVFDIWPANTKSQGYSVFYKPLDWLKKNSLIVDGTEYELDIMFNIKLSHFNKHVANISFYSGDLKFATHTMQNFEDYSGKWDRPKWDEFVEFMDEHFKPEFDWKKQLNWESNFIDTDRNYFTMSLGFEIGLWIPYKDFQEIDKKEDDATKVGNKINAIVDAFDNLITVGPVNESAVAKPNAV